MSEIVRTLGTNTSDPYIVTQSTFNRGRYRLGLKAVGDEHNKLVQQKEFLDDHIRRWYRRGDIEVQIPKHDKSGTMHIIKGVHSDTPQKVLEATVSPFNFKLKTLDLDFLNASKEKLPNSAKRLFKLVAQYIAR